MVIRAGASDGGPPDRDAAVPPTKLTQGGRSGSSATVAGGPAIPCVAHARPEPRLDRQRSRTGIVGPPTAPEHRRIARRGAHERAASARGRRTLRWNGGPESAPRQRSEHTATERQPSPRKATLGGSRAPHRLVGEPRPRDCVTGRGRIAAAHAGTGGISWRRVRAGAGGALPYATANSACSHGTGSPPWRR